MLQLGDQHLLARVLRVIWWLRDAVYHRRCQVTLYNKCRSPVVDETNELREQQAFALAELISYIEESYRESGLKIFKLSELVQLYSEHLEQMGGICSKQSNK